MSRAAKLVPMVALLVGASDAVSQTADRIPAFAVAVVGDERAITDADLHFTYTLINFWSTTCRVCVAELPNLAAAHARFGERIRILSISRDPHQDRVREFRRTRHPMPWTNAWASPNSALFADFGVRGTPYNVLVAPDGRVVARTNELVGERLLVTLERILGPSVGGGS